METTRDFYPKNTRVFWDVEDVSILDHLNPGLVYSNIYSDLEDKGFQCNGIYAFVDGNVSETLRNSYYISRIYLNIGGSRYQRVYNMSVRTLLWAVREREHFMESNLIIFSKNIDEQLTSLVESIKKKADFDIVFLDPSSILENSAGTPPVFVEHIKDVSYRCGTCNSSSITNPNFTKPSLSSNPVDKLLDSPNVETFFSNLSQPIGKFANAYTEVYWFVDDSSIINQLDPGLVYRTITSGLSKKGYKGSNMGMIHAFIEDKNTLSKEVLDIYLENLIFTFTFSKGNKYAMLHEILPWALTKRALPTNLVVLSRNINEEVSRVLQSLRKDGRFNIVFHDPTTLLLACVGEPIKKDSSYRCPSCNSIIGRAGQSSSQNQ